MSKTMPRTHPGRCKRIVQQHLFPVSAVDDWNDDIKIVDRRAMAQTTQVQVPTNGKRKPGPKPGPNPRRRNVAKYDPAARARAVSLVIDENKSASEASKATGIPAAAIPALVGVEKARARKQMGVELPKADKRHRAQRLQGIVSYLTNEAVARFLDEPEEVQLAAARVKHYLVGDVAMFLGEPADVQDAIRLLHKHGGKA